MLGPFHAAAPHEVLRSGVGWNSSLQMAMQASTVAAGAVSGPDRTTAECPNAHGAKRFSEVWGVYGSARRRGSAGASPEHAGQVSLLRLLRRSALGRTFGGGLLALKSSQQTLRQCDPRGLRASRQTGGGRCSALDSLVRVLVLLDHLQLARRARPGAICRRQQRQAPASSDAPLQSSTGMRASALTARCDDIGLQLIIRLVRGEPFG